MVEWLSGGVVEWWEWMRRWRSLAEGVVEEQLAAVDAAVVAFAVHPLAPGAAHYVDRALFSVQLTVPQVDLRDFFEKVGVAPVGFGFHDLPKRLTNHFQFIHASFEVRVFGGFPAFGVLVLGEDLLVMERSVEHGWLEVSVVGVIHPPTRTPCVVIGNEKAVTEGYAPAAKGSARTLTPGRPGIYGPLAPPPRAAEDTVSTPKVPDGGVGWG